MDLGFLDRTSNVTPLLVRLYDSQRLHGLAKDEKPLARVELISAVTELLGMELSPRESELVADVLVGLLRQAEIDLRQALAVQLAAMDNVPLRLVLQLVNDEIEVAAPVLRQSPVLGDLDLIYIIKARGPAYWRAIAARAAISPHVMNLLADTGDMETAVTLAENPDISLSGHTLAVLLDMSRRSDALALPLLRREEIPPELAREIYRFVGDEVKAFIRERYEMPGDEAAAEAIEGAVDDIVAEMNGPAADGGADAAEFTPTASMLRAAERYREKGLLGIKLMLGALRRGQVQSFVAQFACFCGLPPGTVLEILMQPSGQGLAVACRAMEVGKEDFVSIYLLTNRIRGRGRMVDMKDVTKAIGYFDRIKPEIARAIIGNNPGEGE